MKGFVWGGEHGATWGGPNGATWGGFPSGFYVEITPIGENTRRLPDLIETAIDYEHTAMHGGNPMLPARFVDHDDVFGDIAIYANGAELLRGEIEAVEPDGNGRARLKLRGPGLQLTRSGPGQTVEYSNIAYHEAIQNYCDNEAGATIDATVHEPPTTTKADDTEVTNPGFGGTDIYQPAPDEPLEATTNHIRYLQPSHTAVKWADFGGLYTQITSSDQSFNCIRFEGVRVSPGENVTASFTPQYDIPADRVGIKVRGDVDGSGSISYSVTFNGEDIGGEFPASPAPSWQEYADGYGGDDLQAGTTYTFEIDLNSDHEYDLLVDAVNLYDTAYPPTVWDQPSSPSGDDLDGPENFPVDQELLFAPYARPWALFEARIESMWNDTSNGQQIALSPNDGQDYLTFDNQANVNADFGATGYIGDVLQPRVTLSGYGSNDWLNNRANGQEITEYSVFVTTRDLPVIGVEPIMLQDSDFANLQQLHSGDLRFVTDPAADPVAIDSFERGDPAVEKTLDARILEAPEPSRDVTGYGNEVTVKYRETEGGVLQNFTMRDFDEVDRVGAVIPRPPRFSSVSTNDGARNEARNALLNAVGNDEIGGELTTVADVILPGYPYTGIGEWPDGQYTLERTSFQEGIDTAEVTLQFTADDDITQRVVETARQQREAQKNG